MLPDHVFLSTLWVLYCAVHSILASAAIKANITKSFCISGNTYRVLYNLFALVTLVCLIFSHSSVATRLLFTHNYFTLLSSIFLIITGLGIMLVCIIKYFKQLSGLISTKRDTDIVVLETSGVHGYVRHPLYLGTFIFLTGLFLWSPLLSNLIAVLIIIIYTIIGIHFEEQKVLAEFGSNYKKYQQDVPMLLPFLKK
jgi:protein-S-isoprenylcysteine O-methyltransferase Ste14